MLKIAAPDRTWPFAAAPLAYWVATLATDEFRPLLLAILAPLALLWLAGGLPRSLYLQACPVVFAFLTFDLLRYLRPFVHARAHVLTCELRAFDLMLAAPGPDMTWPDFFARHNAPWADLFFAFPYAIFILAAGVAGVMLWFRDRARLRIFIWGMAAMYIVGMSIWVLQPAAPPWYVRQFGCVIDPNAASSAAALLRVDALLGISYFKGVYAAAPYPFGALPSLHNGTAMIVALAAWPIAGWKERAGYVAYVTWMLVASLYLDHHWLIDGLAGWTCAAIGIAVATGLARMKVFREAQA